MNIPNHTKVTSPTKQASPHRIRYKEFGIERYFKTPALANDFSSPIYTDKLHIIDLLSDKELPSAQALTVNQLRGNITEDDFDFICRRTNPSIRVRDALRPEGVDALTKLGDAPTVPYTPNMSVAQAAINYVSRNNKTYEATKVRFMVSEYPKRDKPISEMRKDALEDMRAAYLAASGRRTNKTANEFLDVYSRVVCNVNVNVRKADAVDDYTTHIDDLAPGDSEDCGFYTKPELKRLIKFWKKEDKRITADNYNRGAINYIAFMVELAYWTALRRGDVQELRWDEITSDPKYTEDPTGQLTIIYKVTKQGEKMKKPSKIPLKPEALAILEQIKEYPMPMLKDPSLRDEWVFPVVDPRPNQPGHTCGWNRRYDRDTALLFGDDAKNMGFHALRASRATHMAMKGATAKIISIQLACTEQNAMRYTKNSPELMAMALDY